MLKKDRVNLKRNSSFWFMGFLAIAVLGMMFFLSSSFFFEEKIPMLNTDLNKENSLTGSGKLTINSWLYDENKNEMEVTLITKDVKTIDDNIVFEAFQRNGDQQNLEVKNVFSEDGIYVIKIFGISKEFQQVALDLIRIKENEFENVEGSDEEKKETKEIVTTLYSDQRVVNKKNIKVKTKNEYAVYLSDVLIKQAEIEYKDTRNLIQKEQKKQNELEKEIALNKENMIYETAEEQLETESIINGYQMRIDESKQKIEEFEARGTILKDKKEKLELRKREIDLSYIE
ncbi:hypothetical protein [Peribacillus frigoritolerans]|uniref:hypothetical protein n=1 Tax=Peribacillus frigoritolerans TaxID=450367 RepID=UPI00203FB158|nr:hypothetical protein [Peribacillus frigoritolerans]MCM3169469.1 hypothetical protein [Peribacillus frigoritolerans]